MRCSTFLWNILSLASTCCEIWFDIDSEVCWLLLLAALVLGSLAVGALAVFVFVGGAVFSCALFVLVVDVHVLLFLQA